MLTAPSVRPWSGLVLLLALSSALVLLSCEEGKNSGTGGGAKSSPPAEHVMPGKAEAETPAERNHHKACKNINLLTNYLFSIASKGEVPADAAAARTAFKSETGMGWTKDPWGTLYAYRKTGDTTFEVFSAGADKQEGTADDIRNCSN